MDISLLITDFDGTLVDTFEANLLAYQKAFAKVGLTLSREKYRKCFGYRFDNFMTETGITDEPIKNLIRDYKAKHYPEFFSYLKINEPLLAFIRAFRASGGKAAIASTARKSNLMNVLDFIRAKDDFDFILTGENVRQGKPDPEIYQKVLSISHTDPRAALVFEDSEIGCISAQRAGINYIKVGKPFFNDEI